MKRLIPVLALLLACVLPAYGADIGFSGGSIGFGGGSGGGSSTTNNYLNTFAGANQAAATGLNYVFDTAVSPDGVYVYNVGTLASNSHIAVNKMKISDGSLVATLDLAIAVSGLIPSCEIDSTGAALYVFSGVNYWKIDATALTITHTAAITGGVVDSYKGWDLSPDGTQLVYVNNDVDQTVHFINTSTYAVTNKTLGHSAGGAHTSSVCFLDGTHIYASYTSTATIDQYTTAGVWVLAVNTTDAAGIRQMRAGVNGYLFLQGNTYLVVADPSQAVTTYPNISQPSSLSVDKGAAALSAGNDLALVIRMGENGGYILDGQYVGPSPISFPAQAMWEGVGRVAITQDNTGRGFIGSESATPMIVSLNSDFSGFAGSGANADITGLTGLTGPVTQHLSSDVVGRSLRGSASQTANIEEWHRGSDNYLVGYVDGGITLYFFTMRTEGLTCVGDATAGVTPGTGFKTYTAGSGYSIKTGANAKVGTYTIGGGGSVTIANTSITADSKLFLAPSSGDAITPHENVGARVAATSFQIDGTPGGTGAYEIREFTP